MSMENKWFDGRGGSLIGAIDVDANDEGVFIQYVNRRGDEGRRGFITLTTQTAKELAHAVGMATIAARVGAENILFQEKYSIEKIEYLRGMSIEDHFTDKAWEKYLESIPDEDERDRVDDDDTIETAVDTVDGYIVVTIYKWC